MPSINKSWNNIRENPIPLALVYSCLLSKGFMPLSASSTLQNVNFQLGLATPSPLLHEDPYPTTVQRSGTLTCPSEFCAVAFVQGIKPQLLWNQFNALWSCWDLRVLLHLWDFLFSWVFLILRSELWLLLLKQSAAITSEPRCGCGMNRKLLPGLRDRGKVVLRKQLLVFLGGFLLEEFINKGKTSSFC